MSNETSTTKSVLEALQNDDVKTLKEYLLAGGDVNLTSGESRSTLLHLAIENGCYQCMIVLLNSGANTNLKNGRGETALRLASKLENRQGCILAIQLAISNRKERVKKEAKQREIESARRNGQLATATTAKQQQQSLINVQTVLKRNLDTAQSMLNNLENEADKAKSLVHGLEYQLQELGRQINNLSVQVESSSNPAQTSSGLEWSGDICCMICWDMPEGHVMQCTEGHLLCGECFSNPQIDTCPECRVPLDTQIRNRAVERIISQMKASAS